MGSEVALDTPVFIYFFERRSRHSERCRELLVEVEKGRPAATSALCCAETLVRPLAQHEEQVVHQYLEWFRRFPNLTVRPVDLEIALLTAELRAEYRLKSVDAVVGATALSEGCSRLVTNDGDLRILEDRGVEVEVLGAPA
jgi:predicted nucleic acid-binding protein